MSDDLETAVERLRREVAELSRRVAELEDDGSGSADVDAARPTAGEVDEATDAGDAGASSQSPPRVDAPAGESTTVDAGTAEPAMTPDAPVTDDATADAATVDAADGAGAGSTGGSGDWERDVGTRWLAIAGAAALVLGVVFFVQVAIERGVLGPLARVTVGAVGGLALFGLGRFVAERQGYRRWGTITAGAGLAIAYVSVYASYGFESYRAAIGTPLWATLVGLTLLVGGAVALSIGDGRPAVAAEAYLLGYLTGLVALEAGATALAPAYAVVLAIGVVATTWTCSWRAHVVASVPASYAVVEAWIGVANPPGGYRVAAIAGLLVVHLAGSHALAAGPASRERSLWTPAVALVSQRTGSSGPDDGASGRADAVAVAAATILNGTIGAAMLEPGVDRWLPVGATDGTGVAAVAVALLGLYAVTDRRAVVRDEAAGALGVLLAGASAVVAAGPSFAATAGLLAVLVVAAALADARDATALRTGAHAVAAVTAYKLLVVDLYVLPALDPGAPLAAATSRAAAFALAIATFYTLSWWWTHTPVDHLVGVTSEPPIPAAYAWTASTLAVVLLTLVLSGLGVSVAWALFGLALVGVGLARAARDLRVQGIAVLGLATGKVFLVDTSDLGLLARTASFLALGAVLLAASYAYARWQGTAPSERLSEN